MAPTGAVATCLFVIISGTIVTLIWLLNHAIDRISHHAESTKLILEAQPAGAIGVDAEGRITLVNSAVERQLGYAREELLDQSEVSHRARNLLTVVQALALRKLPRASSSARSRRWH